LVDHCLDVRVNARLAHRKGEFLAPGANDERLVEWLQQTLVQPSAGLVGTHPPDVHAADADTVGDEVGATRVDYEDRRDHHDDDRSTDSKGDWLRWHVFPDPSRRRRAWITVRDSIDVL
jgi:hypothetical protein